MSVFIHPTAVVDKGASLGQDVQIGPYCVIEKDVVLGDRCVLDSFVQIKEYTTIGKENHIHSFCCIGDTPQDMSFAGEKTFTRIGDGNKIREYVTIHRGTPKGRAETIISSNCMLMAYSHVAHDCIINDNVILVNNATLGGHVIVEKYVMLSSFVSIQQHSRVGAYSFVGAYSACTQDVPPYTFVNGASGSQHPRMYGLNSVGLKRQGFSLETRKALKEAYRMLFKGECPRQEALSAVRKEFAHLPEVLNLAEFVESTKIGILSDISRKEEQK